MSRRGRSAAALLLGAALAACGQTDPGSGDLRDGGGLAAIADLARGRFGQAVEPAPFTVTRAQLAAAGITQPFLVARLESGVTAGLFPAASNRGAIVWETEDGIALTGRGDVIVSTRGLGGDLLSAETEDTVRNLAAGRGGRYRRTLRRIDGLGAILRQDYDCTLVVGGAEVVTVLGRAHATRLSTETCRPLGTTVPTTAANDVPEPFVNEYYVGDGTIWVSRQWIGPAVGYLRLERVIE